MTLKKEQIRFRILILSLVFMPILTVAIFGFTKGFYYEELKPLWRVTDFSGRDQQGLLINNQELNNKVWIASFLFTSCSEQCPRIASHMQWLQKELYGKYGIRLISFSVDPDRDTQAKLAQFASLYKAQPGLWSFVRVEKEDLAPLLRYGFRVSGGDFASDPNSTSIFHSAHFILVDGLGWVRGVYDSENPAAMKKLKSDAKGLLRGLQY